MKTFLLIIPTSAAMLFMSSCVSPFASLPPSRLNAKEQAAQDEANTEIMAETQNMINAETSAALAPAQP